MEIPDKILQILREAGLPLAGRIVEIPAVPGGLFIPVAVTRSADGRQQPREAAFVAALMDIQAEGYQPQFLIVDSASKLAEEGLRGSLKAAFPTLSAELYLSAEATKTNVWIYVNRPIDHDEEEEIESHVIKGCDLYRLPPARLIVLGNTKLPTKLEILRIVRHQSPVDCDALKLALEARGYEVPSLDWVNKQFDLLRKGGFLVRLQNRSYTLTSVGLKRMGTIKGRMSPDIDRLLALARGAR